MDLTIVAVYTICDNLLISLGHQEHSLAKMSDAEVMTTALIATRYFKLRQHSHCSSKTSRWMLMSFFITMMIFPIHNNIIKC